MLLLREMKMVEAWLVKFPRVTKIFLGPFKNLYHFKKFISFPPFPQLPLSPRYTSLSPLPKRAGLPGTSTTHGTTRYNKNRHKPPHQGWMRQPSWRKRDLRADKRQRQSTFGSSPKEMKPLLYWGNQCCLAGVEDSAMINKRPASFE